MLAARDGRRSMAEVDARSTGAPVRRSGDARGVTYSGVGGVVERAARGSPRAGP